MKPKQLSEVDLARISAVIDFVNETDRAIWRAHVMSLHAPDWRREFDRRKADRTTA
jgi:hypothetical protein